MGESNHTIIVEDLKAGVHARAIIDVRKPAAYEVSGTIIKGAVWHHPFEVDSWAESVTGPVVVYCVHGHEVSQGVAAYLRARGIDAVYLVGGYEDFVAANGETEPA